MIGKLQMATEVQTELNHDIIDAQRNLFFK
jgi:hypothetical protein